MKITACMLISQPDFKTVQESITSVLKYMKPNEFIMGVAPHVKTGEHYTLRDLTDACWAASGGPLDIKVRGGTDQRKEVARVRFFLFDTASGDWIISLDDDDVALGPLPLDRASSDVGFVHTDVRTKFMVDQSDGSHKAGDTVIRTSESIRDRRRANMFRGSYYAYRRSAWEKVSPYVDRIFSEYEEWRVVWHMIRLGLKDLHVPEILQLQRAQDVAKRVAETRKCGFSWENTLNELEQIFEDRWWQRWRQGSLRKSVEDFWSDNLDQRERRQFLYNVLRDVVAESGVSTVLDFGCGTGEDYPLLSGVLGLSYRGVDITQEMLDRAQERFPIIEVGRDDIFQSKQEACSHPFVNNSAVLPHLPLDKVPTAISELWRITGKVLVVQLFGVDNFSEDETLIRSGFIYQRLREQTWRKMFEAVNPSRLVVHRGQTETTKDLMVVELWK